MPTERKVPLEAVLLALMLIAGAYMRWGGTYRNPGLMLLCFGYLMIGSGVVTGSLFAQFAQNRMPAKHIPLLAGFLSTGGYALFFWLMFGYGEWGPGSVSAVKMSTTLIVTGWIPFLSGLITASKLAR